MKLWLARHTDNATSRWQLAGWLLLLAFPVTALVVNKAASTIFTLFAFAGMWLLLTGNHERPKQELRWVMIAFAGYFIIGLGAYLLSESADLGTRILGRDIRFFVTLPIVFVFLAIRVGTFSLLAAISLSGILAGVTAIVQVLTSDLPDPRASGETISILFGHLSSGLFLIILVFLVLAGGRARLLAAAGSLGALVAVALSQSRGAIIAAVSVAVTLALVSGIIRFRKSRKAGTVVSAAGILFLVMSVVCILASNRFLDSEDEISKALDSLSSSSGEYTESGLPVCRNDRKFLEHLKQYSIFAGSFALEMEIVKIEDRNQTDAAMDCPGGHVLHVRNPSNQSRSWLYLPERSIPPSARGEALLLVQGKGKFGIGGGGDPALRVVDNARAELVKLGGYSDASNRILIMLAPGQQALVWPVVRFPGEYEFLATNSSTGLRLELWMSAMRAFLQEPVTGVGVGRLPDWTESEACEGRTPWANTEFDHAHNEILNTAAERGILGLLSLFAVYAAPFWLFLRRRDVFGYAGMAFVASIFLSGLTETIFNHSLGITYYSMMVLILATAPRAAPGDMTENSQTPRKS